jgi:hypothetical protein
VGRGRSCFSCGETQSGPGQFCRTCGKPLDAPDLELLSGEVHTDSGSDVVMSVGGSKGRSAVAIVAVLAALGGVAAFSGKSTTATVASTTTASQRPTTTGQRTTTTTAPPETSTTSTTDDAAARAREIAMTQPRMVATPILPEKTGLKLLVVGMQQTASGPPRDAIIDLDSGLVTPFAGPSVESAVSDVRDGHLVAEIGLPSTSRLIGLDGQGRPVVVDIGSGTYVLDPATVTFRRITTNLSVAAEGDVRIENVCDEQLRCGTVRQEGEQPAQPLSDIDIFGGEISLSPNGEIMLRASYRNGAQAEAEVIDLTSGAAQKVDVQADSSPLQIVWSPDSKWLLGFANGVVKAWKVGTPDTLTLSLDGVPLRATAVGVFPTG